MLPTIRPDALKLVYPQPMDVSEVQLPEKSCTNAPDELRLEPMAPKLTIALEELAVNLYQTSSSGAPDAQPVGMPLLAVASHTVPALLVVPIVKAVAPEHSSFDGGNRGITYDTQMLKVHLLLGVDVGAAVVKTLK